MMAKSARTGPVVVAVVAFAGGIVVATALSRSREPVVEHHIIHDGDRMAVGRAPGDSGRRLKLRVDVPDQPPGTRVEWDGAVVGDAPTTFTKEIDEDPHDLRLTPPDREPVAREFRTEPDLRVDATFAVGTPDEANDDPDALTAEQAQALLEEVDARTRRQGPTSEKIYLEVKAPGAPDRAFDLSLLRWDRESQIVLLVAKPKIDAGRGYLRIGPAVWFYDSNPGQWTRLADDGTDRVLHTLARVRDFGPWDLASRYRATYVRSEKLGAFVAHRLHLTPTPGTVVALPLVSTLWVDTATSHPLKMESVDRAGVHTETRFFPRWMEAKGPSGETWAYPQDTHIRDVASQSQTQIVVRQAESHSLPPNVFTKAWVESQSR